MAEPSREPIPSPAGFRELLRRLGIPRDLPPRPVIHTERGTLFSFAFLNERFEPTYVGLLLSPGPIELLGPEPESRRLSAALHLDGPTAELADRLSQATRGYLERVEELDEQLVAIGDGWSGRLDLERLRTVGRRCSRLRREVARTLSVASAASRLADTELPGAELATPALIDELERIQQSAEGVDQGIANLLLLQNAQMSNRIAAFANVANIRMLGLSYLALLLAVVGAIILFPNTGATILGMPSAAWVPGIWVDLILLVLAVVPIAILFAQGWLRRMFREVTGFESRSAEGIADIPEISPSEATGMSGGR
ncbi:MAG TPA: hypothetical protein VGU43_01770 [Thermoplasmata archaeon]|nr:hypothetical protein [Thermoplasmata archaeon]